MNIWSGGLKFKSTLNNISFYFLFFYNSGNSTTEVKIKTKVPKLHIEIRYRSLKFGCKTCRLFLKNLLHKQFAIRYAHNRYNVLRYKVQTNELSYFWIKCFIINSNAVFVLYERRSFNMYPIILNNVLWMFQFDAESFPPT